MASEIYAAAVEVRDAIMELAGVLKDKTATITGRLDELTVELNGIKMQVFNLTREVETIAKRLR